MLSEEDQLRRREWFRRHWESGVPFNRLCDLRVTRWDAEQVVVEMPFSEQLTAHEGLFHGGVLSALADTAGVGAVLAGHDFNSGTQPITLSLAMQYFAAAPRDGLIAEAVCTKRGRTNFAQVVLKSTSGKALAHALVTVAVTGRPPAS